MDSREWKFTEDQQRANFHGLKAEWGNGPWLNEPDKVQFPDEATGLACVARRAPGGHWCGYVGVAPGHPWYEKDYDAVDVDVHGGLTYAALCAEDHELGVCHVPDPGEPDELWWFGFDCAHLYDLSPRHTAGDLERGWSADPAEIYRTLGYVKDECARLARQVKEAA